MNYFIYCLKNYAKFTGRARRSEFWFFALFQAIASAVAGLLDYLLGTGAIIAGIVSLGLIVPALAVTVRRLHDLGKGGGWIFISLVPVVGQIWMLILLLTDSEVATNRFGENPKLATPPTM